MEEYPRNEELKNIFQRVGAKHGYQTVDAEFMAFTDVKVRWQRSYGWIDFRISDYLTKAPADALEGLAKNLFDRLEGKDTEYSPILKEWLTSQEFIEKNQQNYLERCIGYQGTAKGKHKDLNESMKRLQDAGLIGDLPGVYLTWEDNLCQKMGHCSVLMKAVAINDLLDDENVPDYVLDYCLYRELLHIQIGYNPDGLAHEEEFQTKCQDYKMQDEADSWLRSRAAYA